MVIAGKAARRWTIRRIGEVPVAELVGELGGQISPQHRRGLEPRAERVEILLLAQTGLVDDAVGFERRPFDEWDSQVRIAQTRSGGHLAEIEIEMLVRDKMVSRTGAADL